MQGLAIGLEKPSHRGATVINSRRFVTPLSSGQELAVKKGAEVGEFQPEKVTTLNKDTSYEINNALGNV